MSDGIDPQALTGPVAVVPLSTGTPVLAEGTRVDLTKDDVLDVAVLHAEQAIEQGLAAAREQLDATQARARISHDKVAKALGKFRKSLQVLLTPSVTALTREANKLSGKRVRADAHVNLPDDACAKIRTGARAVPVSVFVQLAKGGASYGSVFNLPVKTRKVRVPVELIGLCAQAERDDAAAGQAAEAINKWTMAKNDVPKLKRRFRAKLAEAQLSRTVAGQRILQALLRDITADVLSVANQAEAG